MSHPAKAKSACVSTRGSWGLKWAVWGLAYDSTGAVLAHKHGEIAPLTMLRLQVQCRDTVWHVLQFAVVLIFCLLVRLQQIKAVLIARASLVTEAIGGRHVVLS